MRRCRLGCLLAFQVALVVAGVVGALIAHAVVASESLSDQGSVGLAIVTFAGLAGLTIASLAAALGAQARGRRLAFAAAPMLLLLLCGVFARSVYPETSVEMEALREEGTPPGPGTTIALGPTGSDVRLSGEIVEGAAARLDALLDANPDVDRIVLTSEGGLADEGQAIGDVIADHGIATYIPDYCVSACTLAFVRGRQRYVMKGGRVGFHGPFQEGLFGRTFTGDSKAAKAAYVEAGVQPAFADEALKVSPDDMWFPSADRLIAAHVATQIVDRDRFPDSNLDGQVSLEGARKVVLDNFPVLKAYADLAPKALDTIAAWYLDAYRRGATEAETTADLRAIVRGAVLTSLAQGDDATVLAVARYLAQALGAASSAQQCFKIGERADLVEAERQLARSDPAAADAAAILVSRSIKTREAPAAVIHAARPDHRIGPEECRVVRATYATILALPPAEAVARIHAMLKMQATASLADLKALHIAQ